MRTPLPCSSLQAGAASAGQSLALSARLAALRAAYDATAEVRLIVGGEQACFGKLVSAPCQ